MMLRSFLFVPADSERKIARGLQSEADALILDLEDSVTPDRKAEARKLLTDQLANLDGSTAPKLYVRINPLDSPHVLEDLLAATHAAVAGIVLPKACGRHDIDRCGHYLDMAESVKGIAPGAIGILPVVTETAAAVLKLPEFAAPIGRLQAMTWGGEDLATVLGARGNRRPSGEWDDSFRLARGLALLAASACDVPAIDTLHADFRDADGLRAVSLSARHAGFAGKIAIHPDQVAVINEAFSPNEAEIADAKTVVAAFAASPGSGAVGLGGRMLDRPHLVAAQRLLATAGEVFQP
jgi:citrate lyase subunit beta/citryl-CoA lyase